MAQPTVEFIWKNGELVEWEKATTHVLTHALHYGSGVFEGIRAYATDRGPAIFRLREHMQRLLNSSRMLYMDIPYTLDEICQVVVDTVAANKVDSCYIRPLVYRGYGSMGVDPLAAPVDIIVACWPWDTYLGAEAIEAGISVGTSSWRQRSINALPPGIKATGNYVNSGFARVEATRNGYGEAVILNEAGQVCEGSGDNLFVVYGTTVVTPPVSDGILPGITRASILELARDLGYDTQERSLARTELYTADEFFLTGTAAEVVPVTAVDGITVGNGRAGDVTKALQKAFFDIVEGRSDAHGDWITYVR
ncbi:MAG: branched-chain amino acid transaminase [Actinomycetes bacterium]|nr:branched-chain amino acid transaminase [Actinomycetes bacterium]